MEVSVSGQAIPCSRQGGWAVSGRSGTAVLRHLPHLSGHKNRPGRGPGRGQAANGARNGSDASSLSCYASLRLRPVSLRLGTAIAGYARLSWLFLAPVQPGCSGGFALLPCHASPAHDARLPSDSGQIRSGCARPGFCPSLQSIRAVRNGSDASSKHSINSATIWLTSPAGRSILYSVSVTISPPPMGERSAYPC